MLLGVERQRPKRNIHEITDTVQFPTRDNKIIRCVERQNSAHRLYIIESGAPIDLGAEIAKRQLLHLSVFYRHRRLHDLSSDKSRRPARRFVIVQNARTAMQTVLAPIKTA